MGEARRYPPRLAELVDILSSLDRAERIQALIEMSERYREVPAAIARRPFPEERKVPACESEAYVWAVPNPAGTLDLHFAVENPQGVSAKAMAVVLKETLGGEDCRAVAKVPEDLVYEIFGRELSMGKSMGLMAMVGLVTHAARRLGEARDPSAVGVSEGSP